MSLDSIISSQINRETQFASQQGFGTPMVLVNHALYPDRIRYYGSLKEAVDAGFTSTAYPQAYRRLSKLFSQNPRPTKVAIGRSSVPWTKTIQLVPKVTTQGTIYNFTVEDSAGVAHDITHTVGAAATVATIIDEWVLLVNPLALVNAADNTTNMAVTASVAGAQVRITNLPSPALIEVLDVTADPGITAELDAINTIDGAGWYFLLLADDSKASQLAAAAWTQARAKEFFYDTTDSENQAVGVTTGVGAQIKALSQDRSYGSYVSYETDSGHAAALVGRKSVVDLDSGSTSWEYANLASIKSDTLTDGQRTVLADHGLGWYTEEGGSGAQINTLMAGLEWIDIIHGIDWLNSRLQTDVFSLIRNANNAGRKIPATTRGMRMIEGVVKTRLNIAVGTGFLDGERPPVVIAKTIDQIAAPDRAARLYRQVDWNAFVAGAFHKVNIIGTLSV